MRAFTLLSTLCLLAVFSLPASARNIFTEQTEAGEARESHLKAQKNLTDIQSKIEQRKTVIAREQAELAKLESEEKKARAELEKSQANLDAKTKALEKAWGQRD